MISFQDFRSIAKGENTVYEFNFAYLSLDSFPMIMQGINTYGPKSITTIAFISSKWAETDDDFVSIDDNMAKVFPQFIQELAKLFKNSSMLTEIHFVNLKLSPTNLIDLSSIFKYSKTLAIIDFTNINIGDQLIVDICKNMLKSSVASLYYRNCGLTNTSIKTFVAYAKTIRDKWHYDGGLQELDLSDNQISPKEFQRVVDALNPTEFEYNTTPGFENEMIPKEYDDTEEGRLQHENDDLKVEIERLRGIINEVEINNGLFIVGEGSKEVIDYMKRVDVRLSNLEPRKK